MASCARCGAALLATARFCPACGSPVTPSAAGRAPTKPGTAPVPSTDPYARTLSAPANVQPTGPMPSPVSPMASSVMKNPGDPLPTASPVIVPWNQAQPAVAATVPAPPPSPSAPPAVPLPYAFPPGSMVLVHWADGNRYPGTVLQASGAQLLVAFPNGQQQWVDARYVSVGG